MDELLDDQVFADFLAQVAQLQALLAELFLKLLPAVGTLKLGQFLLHFGFRNRDLGVRGMNQQDLIVDQLIQDI